MSSGKAAASSKKVLFEDSSDNEADHGTQLTINKEYAAHHEHQNKIKEMHQLEEKFKREGRNLDNLDESSEESSDDEPEDENAFFATEELDAQITATIKAIRNKDAAIYDPNFTLFTDKDTPSTLPATEKPYTLKDFHREQYQNGVVEAEEHEIEGAPMTYTQEQDALKKSIVSSINAAGAQNDSDSDEGDDFLKRKTPKEVTLNADCVHPDREGAQKPVITETDVVNADENPEAFLETFMASCIWKSGPDGSNWNVFDSDDDDEALESAEQFEHAYNMRFEDPTKSNEVLQTYSRVLVNSKSLRQEEKSTRKRARDAEKERREEQKRQKREERARLKKLKLDEMQHKLNIIRKTAGTWGKQLTEEELLQFLNDTYEDEKWEEEMNKRFGEDYYKLEDEGIGSGEKEEVSEVDEEGKIGKKSKKPKKPTWDDDIDVSKFGEEPALTREFSVADLEDSDNEAAKEEEEEEEEEEDDDDEDGERPSKKSKTSKKDYIKERKASKEDRNKLSTIVDMHMDIDDPDISIPSRRKRHQGHPTFRYRETSPTSYGLTARDVLLAPSDTALKKFASLKKYAEWRLPEQKDQDSRKLGKKARLRKWRREVFGKDFEKSGPTYGFGELFQAEKKSAEWGIGNGKGNGKGKGWGGDEEEVKVRKDDIKEDGEGKKKRRSKKKRSKVTAE